MECTITLSLHVPDFLAVQNTGELTLCFDNGIEPFQWRIPPLTKPDPKMVLDRAGFEPAPPRETALKAVEPVECTITLSLHVPDFLAVQNTGELTLCFSCGFEPLQRMICPLTKPGLKMMVHPEGLEPSTRRLEVCCSDPTELRVQDWGG